MANFIGGIFNITLGAVLVATNITGQAAWKLSPSFSVYATTATIQVGGWIDTKIFFNVTNYNYGNCFSASTFTPNVAGRYIFNVKIFKMAPIHHHFELNGWSEEKTIMRFWMIHFVFVIFGIWLALN